MRTAIEVIRNAAGSQLDPELIDVFLALIEEEARWTSERRDREEATEEEQAQVVLWPATERAVTRV